MRLVTGLILLVLATSGSFAQDAAELARRAAAIKATQTYGVVEYPHIWSWGVLRYTAHPASFERSAIMGMYKTRAEAEAEMAVLRSK